jgi:hypothetical protein
VRPSLANKTGAEHAKQDIVVQVGSVARLTQLLGAWTRPLTAVVDMPLLLGEVGRSGVRELKSFLFRHGRRHVLMGIRK